MHRLPVGVLFALLASPVAAESVTFERTHNTAWGESVYLLGDLEVLGGDHITRARRMVPGSNGRWSLTVELPAGAAYEYAFWVRSNDANAIGDSNNGRRVSKRRSATAPGALRSRSVRVSYLSGWPRAFLRYQAGASQVSDVELVRSGPGRGPGEWTYEATVSTDRSALLFVPHDGNGDVDQAPSGSAYQTGFSSFTLASGRIHEGQPAPSALDAERGRVVRVERWYSNTLGNARPIQIYLPPGYDRSGLRYPVLYMHDGQNLFGADAMFGGWRVAETCDRLIAEGRLRPVIVVGVGNTAARMSEYIPEADGGEASRYGAFLTDELKPWVDQTLRTRPEREHTGVCGSSLGGLVSLFLGWSRPDVFSRIGSLSGSYWLRAWVDDLERSTARPSLRVWLDSGNQGSSADSLENTLRVRDVLLRKSWALGGDLEHFVDYGASHNERYWRGRLSRVLRFLFPPE
jgi:predicted alpha/beta superfamily hydrolase